MTTEIPDLHLLERQPKCIQLTVFEGYWASWHEPCETGARRVATGVVGPIKPSLDHPGIKELTCPWEDWMIDEYPDTAEEAARLYAEACEWLRERAE